MINTASRGAVVLGGAALFGLVPVVGPGLFGGVTQARADGPVGNGNRVHLGEHRHVGGGHAHRGPGGSGHDNRRPGTHNKPHGPHRPGVPGVRAAPVAKVGITTNSPGGLVLPGHTYSWPYSVTNRSPVEAEQVAFSTPLPSSLRFVSGQNCSWQTGWQQGGRPQGGQAQGGPAQSGLPQGGQVQGGEVQGGQAQGGAAVCRLGPLKAGQSWTGVISAEVAPGVKPGQVISAPAVLTWTGARQVTSLPGVRVADFADVAVAKGAPARIRPGQSVPYAITVRNNGPSAARTVVLHDSVRVPAKAGQVLRPVEQTDTQCAGSPGEAGHGQTLSLTCDLGTLKAGESRTIRVGVQSGPRIRPGTILQAPSEVSSSTVDTDTANNQATVSTAVIGAPRHAAAAAAGELHPNRPQLPNTGAPVTGYLHVVAGLLGSGLILYRIGRPRRRRG